MRITNKIMQRNNLANINNNKVYQDTLSTQMSTQKKINRPSDDPVVAIRALRLRSNVTEVTQYYSKNIPDAESWLNITEDALKNQSSIVTEMIKQCTKGANGDLKNTDRQIILEQLKALASEAYSTANADYAGRYVFTGYRTDMPLSFIAGTNTKYEITEQLHRDAIDVVTKVDLGDVLELTENNFASMGGITEGSISSVECYRIQLAYGQCSDDASAIPTITTRDPSVTFPAFTMVHVSDNPYVQAANNDDAMIYVPETGEILLGKNNYDKLMGLKDDPLTTTDESEFRITYQKNEWVAGDLRPEHYFACTDLDQNIVYNEDYLTSIVREHQEIEYDVGFNQTIRVNSTADECFKHGIGRTIDDLVNAIQEVQDLEDIKTMLEKKISATLDEGELDILNEQLRATDKALTMSKDKGQKMFEKSITIFQGYLDEVDLSITDCGTRSSKLELIKNRMQNQKTTIETLKSENEDIDITEVAIQLQSAGLTYEAALMASGKVMQSTLLNYI